MKTLKYIGLFIASFMFAACAVDEMGSADAESLADNSPVVISISDKNMLPVDMMKTRAGVDMNTILSTVNDLNVRVNLKDNSVKFIYCTKSAVGTNDVGASFIPNHELSSMTAGTPTQLHLDKIKASQVTSVEVIANYGKAIIKDADWKGAKESETTPASGNALKEPALLPQAKNSISTMTCMMYGRADALAAGSIHTDKATNSPCKYFDISLKRTRAIVTVKIVGTGLNDGVEITVKELRLYNTPKECVLTSLAPGKGNKIASSADVYSPLTTTVGLGTLTNGKKTGTRNQMGAHLDEVPADQTAEWAFPMFMYENLQGTNPNTTGKVAAKYPQGISSVADAKDPSKNYKASYIEIVGDYKYREAAKGKAQNPVKVGGTIVYRFFLGADALQDFNVEGNHYYKLTLNLKGFGGAKEDGKTDASGNLIVNDSDVSWRVDLVTKDWGFEQSQFDFDGHLIQGAVNVIGDDWTFTEVLAGDPNSSWLMLNAKYGGYEWANPTSVMNGAGLLIKNGKLRFTVQPMYYSPSTVDPNSKEFDPGGAFNKDSYKWKKNYREMAIVVQRTSTKERDTVYVRQYVPISLTTSNGVTFFMERFEEYENDIMGYPWKYQGDNLSNLHIDDGNGSSLSVYGKTYNWGNNVSKDNVGDNMTYLIPKMGWNSNYTQKIEYDTEGRGSAAYVSYLKGTVGVGAGLQGTSQNYWAVPSQDMMEAILSYKHDSAWGPFEPVHIYENYWTSSVQSKTPTFTAYYDGYTTGTFSSTDQRNQNMRVRSIYTAQFNSISK